MASVKVPKRLTRKLRTILAANSAKWRKEFKPMKDAIRRSTRITAEDLAIRITE